MIRLDPDDPDADDDEKTPVKVHPANSSIVGTPNNVNSVNNTHSIVQNYNMNSSNLPQQQQQNVALPINLVKIELK